MKFTDVFVGYPDRCHDASIWKSRLVRGAITNNLIRFPPECHLLGDTAYSLEMFIWVPYADNSFLTAEQLKYNNIHSSTRVSVKQAFRILNIIYLAVSFVSDVFHLVASLVSLP